MDQVLHANIFFIIASVATVVFCILIVVILYHVLKLVKAIRRIVDRVEAGSEQLADDLTTLRTYVAGGGVITRVLGFFMPRGGRRGKRARQYDVTEDDV